MPLLPLLLTLTLAWDAGVLQAGQTPPTGYVLVRDGVEVAQTSALTATDTLPGPGRFTYTVQATAIGADRSDDSRALTVVASALTCALAQTDTGLTLTCVTAPPPGPPPGPYPLRPVGTVSVQAVDSDETGYEARLALDGRPATLWTSQWRCSQPPLPHTLTLDLGAGLWVDGLSYLPRQDGNLTGTLTSARVETSTDLRTWTVVASATWASDATPKTTRFPATQARYVRLIGLASTGTPFASAAEVGVYAVEETR